MRFEPCRCGDTMCAVCGPLQGYGPTWPDDGPCCEVCGEDVPATQERNRAPVCAGCAVLLDLAAGVACHHCYIPGASERRNNAPLCTACAAAYDVAVILYGCCTACGWPKPDSGARCLCFDNHCE